MKYLFSKCEPAKHPIFLGDYTMPAWAVERWTRQMNTPYAELPENEKASDREEADKMLAILEQAHRGASVPSEVMEAMELVCDKLAQLMPYPAPQEVIDIRTWLAQQRGQG